MMPLRSEQKVLDSTRQVIPVVVRLYCRQGCTPLCVGSVSHTNGWVSR